jgi:hypothetical protein
MADSPAIVAPSKPKEAAEEIQKSLRSDTSYLDKIRKDPTRIDNSKKSLYWYGTLPSISANRTGKSAGENWNRAEGLAQWVGKCEWFQNICIRGMTFSAFTGTSQRSPLQDPSQAISFGITKAGFVEEFTDEQVKQIMYEADHHMIAPPPDGKTADRAEIYRMIEIDGQWKHESQNPEFQTYIRKNYDPTQDRPVSDFVYFMKIKDGYQQQDLPSLMKNPPASLSGK